MKILALTAAALLTGTAAFAQTTAPTPGAATPALTPNGGMAGDSMTARGTPSTSGTTTPDAGSATTGNTMGTAPGSDASSSTSSTTTTTLTERSGVWYNGDRRATQDEIAQYRKAKKNRPS